jgi:hypothetical protein
MQAAEPDQQLAILAAEVITASAGGAMIGPAGQFNE